MRQTGPQSRANVPFTRVFDASSMHLPYLADLKNSCRDGPAPSVYHKLSLDAGIMKARPCRSDTLSRICHVLAHWGT